MTNVPLGKQLKIMFQRVPGNSLFKYSCELPSFNWRCSDIIAKIKKLVENGQSGPFLRRDRLNMKRFQTGVVPFNGVPDFNANRRPDYLFRVSQSRELWFLHRKRMWEYSHQNANAKGQKANGRNGIKKASL